MRLPRIVISLALLSPLLLVPAYAQRGGGHAGGGGGHGGGNFGGGGGRMGGFAGGGGFHGGGFTGGSFHAGGFTGGFGHGHFCCGFRYGVYGGFGGYWGYPYWGWGYPYYGFGGYPYGYGYSPFYYDPYPYYGYVSQPYYAAPPPGEPVYSQPAAPPPNQTFYRTPDFYLIAFTDNTIQAAISFSVDGDRIRWTTREHVDREAPLSSVDRRFSEELNRDRHVEFRLP